MSVDVFVLGQLQPHRNDIINFILNDCTTAAQTKCGFFLRAAQASSLATRELLISMHRCKCAAIIMWEKAAGRRRNEEVAMGKGGKGKESESEASKSARNMFFCCWLFVLEPQRI